MISAVSLCTIFGKTDLVPVTNTTSECSLELLSLPTLSSAVVPMDTNGGLDMAALSVLNTAESPINCFTVGVLISGAIALSANILGRFPGKLIGIVLLLLSNSDESDEEVNNFSFLLCFSFEDFTVLAMDSIGPVFLSPSSSLLSLSSLSPPGGRLT